VTVTTKQTSFLGSLSAWWRRPTGRLGLSMLVVAIVSAPWVLFFDPVSFRAGHIARDPIAIYRLHSDDFAYVGASRTLARAASNLFVPHNTHIVPAWRLLTWAVVAWSGTLARLPETLAVASYGILVAVMLLTGRIVARESGRTAAGLAAMAAVGTTSLMGPSVCWYSAGQTLWAGFGILAALWYAQCWRRARRIAALPLSAASAMLAGWFWTIGHMAGPVAAIYLWLDGRRRCRWGALAPLAGTALAVGLSLLLGAGKIDSTVSFHGRSTAEAADPIQGALHTAQAIPENLILGNLGLRAQTTQAQGVMLTLAVAALWIARRWRQGGPRAFNPLELSAAALVLGSYLVEWTVRGYFDFKFLRTLNMVNIVPWYDAIPQVGAVLFAAGWWMGPRGEVASGRAAARRPVSRAGALAILGLVALLVVLNRPRMDLLWRKNVPPLLESERKQFPILRLQSMRASALLLDRADRQRRHLRRLDLAQRAIDGMGLSERAVHRAFGRLDLPDLPEVYDAIVLLAFPDRPRSDDPALARSALAPYFLMEEEPRPPWIDPGETWPPSPTPPDRLRVEVYGDE
jgi:hypothetical protein